jgi:hypothetical protein
MSHISQNELLLSEQRLSRAAAMLTRRRPVPGPAPAPIQAQALRTEYEQYPVPMPNADRDHTQSVDSMHVLNDTPSYQNRLHPAPNTNCVNVPTGTQSLLHTNNQAMMGTNRLDDAKTMVPTLPTKLNDTREPAPVNRNLTPNTRAENNEKRAMKQMCGPTRKVGD